MRGSGLESTFPVAGANVWSVPGITAAPPNQAGSILECEGRGIYAIRWDDGVKRRHWSKEFLCLGPFQTLDGLLNALRRGRRSPTLHVGPRGGFLGVSVVIPYGTRFVTVVLDKQQNGIWQHVFAPALTEMKIEATRSASAPPTLVHVRSTR